MQVLVAHLVVAFDGWIVSQISSHSGCDNVVGATDQATHECEEKKEDGHWNIVHVLSKDVKQRT